MPKATRKRPKSIEAERVLFAKHIGEPLGSEGGASSISSSTRSSTSSSRSSSIKSKSKKGRLRKLARSMTTKDMSAPPQDDSASQQQPGTVQEANDATLGQQRRSTKPKSWLARGLTGLMQLPNATPTAVLRWTVPQGPMPHILDMPSRDAGRTVKLYVFIPPDTEKEPSRRAASEDATPNDLVTSSFDGVSRPCVIDFHGGGFVMGGPLEQAPWCAALARSGVLAISVHYRLGPTWEFPAALLDAEDTVRAVLDAEGRTDAGRYLRRQLFDLSGGRIGLDESRVGLSGFSSGGNIALNMLLSIPAQLNLGYDAQGNKGGSDDVGEDWPSPFPASHRFSIPALLFFPSLDARQAPFERARPEGMPPPGEMSKWIGRTIANAYLPSHVVGHPRASPGLAPIGVPGGVQAEVQVRQEAAHEHGVKEPKSGAGAQRLVQAESGGESGGAGAGGGNQDCMHASARALLVLPTIDTLSEQSEVWVDALQAAGKLVVSEEQDGSRIGVSLDNNDTDAGRVRVHRIRGMGHGFTTYPDTFIDEKTRAAKKLVMEQARRYLVNMWND